MLIARRHVGGPAHFNDQEARSFGPTLRDISKRLEEETGALRIRVCDALRRRLAGYRSE